MECAFANHTVSPSPMPIDISLTTRSSLNASSTLTEAIDSTLPYMRIRCTMIATSSFSSRDRWEGGGRPATVINYWRNDGGVNDWSIGLNGGYGHLEGQRYDGGCVDDHFSGGRRRQVKQKRNNDDGESFQMVRIGMIK